MQILLYLFYEYIRKYKLERSINMNQQNMTKSKMLICWGLIVVGTILLLTQSGKSMPLLVGAALLFVGLLLSKGH